MTDRYFADTPISGEKATLVGPEAHHLIHVMRAKPGDRVVLFDGGGAEYAAQVERLRRTEVELAILARHEVDRELPVELTLGVALPKGERQRWLVEKAVELGVQRLVPVDTQRSVARPAERTLARLRRAVIEASKQCGRNRLMEIAVLEAWPDFIAANEAVERRLLAHPEGGATDTKRDRKKVPRLGATGVSPVHGQDAHAPEGGATDTKRDRKKVPRLGATGVSPVHGQDAHGTLQPPCRECPAPLSHTVMRSLVGQVSRSVVVAVGPEGGFTGNEITLATSAGWQLVDLGPRILRTETAAILLASIAALRAEGV